MNEAVSRAQLPDELRETTFVNQVVYTGMPGPLSFTHCTHCESTGFEVAYMYMLQYLAGALALSLAGGGIRETCREVVI